MPNSIKEPAARQASLPGAGPAFARPDGGRQAANLNLAAIGPPPGPQNSYTYALIESRSAGFVNEGATSQWLAGSASYFDASLAVSPAAAEETIARIFLAAPESSYSSTKSLTVATLDNESGQWQYEDVPVPPPASQPRGAGPPPCLGA